MKGAANGGRLNGVGGPTDDDPGVSDHFPVADLGSDSGFGSSGDSVFASVPSSSLPFSTGFGCKKRMTVGSTETRSPGARRVFAFWCYER